MSGTDDALTERYLEYVRVEKRLAPRTVELYALDLHRLCEAAAQVPIALTAVRSPHIRRWVAQMHGAGRSGRGIALILSGWRGFYAWLGREGLIASNPVQGVRAPKAAKPLPKALGVDEAVQLASFKNDSASRTPDKRYSPIDAESADRSGVSEAPSDGAEAAFLNLRDAGVALLQWPARGGAYGFERLAQCARRSARPRLDRLAQRHRPCVRQRQQVAGRASGQRSLGGFGGLAGCARAVACPAQWRQCTKRGAVYWPQRHAPNPSIHLATLAQPQPASGAGHASPPAHAAPFVCQPLAAIQR